MTIGLTVLVVVVGGAAVIWGFTKSPDSAQPGDCLNIKSFSETNPQLEKVDCGDPTANVKVGVRLDKSGDQCPDGDYDHYSVSGSSSYKLCLTINAKQGECFANVLSDNNDGYKRVACTDPTADVEFVKIVDGTAEDSACEGVENTVPLKYSQPATTLCVKPLKETTA